MHARTARDTRKSKQHKVGCNFFAERVHGYSFLPLSWNSTASPPAPCRPNPWELDLYLCLELRNERCNNLNSRQSFRACGWNTHLRAVSHLRRRRYVVPDPSARSNKEKEMKYEHMNILSLTKIRPRQNVVPDGLYSKDERKGKNHPRASRWQNPWEV